MGLLIVEHLIDILIGYVLDPPALQDPRRSEVGLDARASLLPRCVPL